MKDYFQDGRELACPCCGLQDMRPGFYDRLNLARDAAGIPFRINSGVRCEEHNKKVGGSPRSAHLTGAADIRCTESAQRMKIVSALLGAGFTRIGVYPTFIHADDNPDLPQGVMWFSA